MPSPDYANIADLYDVYVNTGFDIPYWLSLAEAHPGPILELMCGTGRVTVPLLQAGRTITAVDNSPELLAILQEKLDQTGLACDLRRADVSKFDLQQQYDLVILPFNSFAEIQTPDAQLQALQAIHRHLSEDGRFVCTLHNPSVRLQSVDGQLRLVASYPLAEGRLLFWMHQQYHEAENRVEVMQFYEEYDAESVMQRKRMLQMSFSIIYYDAFAEMVVRAGLRVLDCFGDYSDAPYDDATSPFMIWHLARA